ncbi:MAG: DegT/DnrJ/EryC1/StrS family aminotransferase [Flavobacteriales bacterium]|nr:DegT/DnrJ/EryC1/StrS family aminotransferase [Flavobacteriales bacterium]
MIQKDAADVTKHVRDWTFTNSARTAFEVLLRGRSWPSGSSLLMPGYIGFTDREGSGVFDPVRNTGTPFTFYPIGERLQVDLERIEALLATGNHPMILVIHYFGLAHVDMAAMQELCSRYKVILVEDCAHVPLTTDAGLGTYGGAAFHSLHKILAVPDGGVLRINDPSVHRGTLASGEACAASTMEHVLRSDLPAIKADRKRNYAFLAERLKDVEGVEVLYPSIGEWVPHDFPIRVKDGLREKLYFALMEKALPTTALYYRMIDEITVQDHPNSYALSTSILNLPVHQDTGENDLRALCDTMEKELTLLRS